MEMSQRNLYTRLSEKRIIWAGLKIGRSRESAPSIMETKYVLNVIWSIYIRNIWRNARARLWPRMYFTSLLSENIVILTKVC